jgi:hypothetical protein
VIDKLILMNKISQIFDKVLSGFSKSTKNRYPSAIDRENIFGGNSENLDRFSYTYLSQILPYKWSI